MLKTSDSREHGTGPRNAGNTDRIPQDVCRDFQKRFDGSLPPPYVRSAGGYTPFVASESLRSQVARPPLVGSPAFSVKGLKGDAPFSTSIKLLVSLSIALAMLDNAAPGSLQSCVINSWSLLKICKSSQKCPRSSIKPLPCSRAAPKRQVSPRAELMKQKARQPGGTPLPNCPPGLKRYFFSLKPLKRQPATFMASSVVHCLFREPFLGGSD